MLVFGSRLINTPVLSLQTGRELARANHPIIDPRHLTIVAYEVTGPRLDQTPSLLRIADVREFSDIGMIIDSSDELVGPSDVIKLSEIIELNFKLIDLPVKDERGRKLGRVVDYSVEVPSFVIAQLSVKRPLFRSLNDSELLIHRSQIAEITDDQIIVKSAEDKPKPIKQSARQYTNPFRSQTPQTDTRLI